MSMRRFRRLAHAACIAIAAAAGLTTGGAAAIAADSAVILQYHRFGEDQYPSTSVTIEQLEAHIEHLEGGGYAVLPLPEILDALRAGRPLPERAVAITVDDATRSTFVEAWPRLEAAGFPFTVFVSTDPVDEGHAGIMSWDELRQLAAAGVTIGNHGAAHGYMWRNDDATNRADLERARQRLGEELGIDPTIFAYPYGEWDGALRALVADQGFSAAFGQHSGVVGAHSDWLNLPRFALNQNYGDMDRLRLITDTVPLGARDITRWTRSWRRTRRPWASPSSRRWRTPPRWPATPRAASRPRSSTGRKAASRCASTGPSRPDGPASIAPRPPRAGAGTGSGFSSSRPERGRHGDQMGSSLDGRIAAVH